MRDKMKHSPREIQPNERKNETNLRDGQQNVKRNETNLREGQTSERRNKTNLWEGQPNERRNEAFPRASRRNEMTHQRRAPSGRIREGAEGTSVGYPEKENVRCSIASSLRETSSRDSGRPQSGCTGMIETDRKKADCG